MDGQVAIPDVGVRRNRLPLARFNWRRRRLRHADRKPLHDLADSPMAVVVGVQNADSAVRLLGGGNGHKPILRVVGVGENAIARPGRRPHISRHVGNTHTVFRYSAAIPSC